MYLVLYARSSNTCQLYVAEDGAYVGKGTITWFLAKPGSLTRVMKRTQKIFIGGSFYEKGAIYGTNQAELADMISSVIGPSEEDQKLVVQAEKPPVWLFFLLGSVGFIFMLAWLFAKTLMFIALVPVLIFFFGRRIR